MVVNSGGVEGGWKAAAAVAAQSPGGCTHSVSMSLGSEMLCFANDEMPEHVTYVPLQSETDPSQPLQPVHLVASSSPHTTQSGLRS